MENTRAKDQDQVQVQMEIKVHLVLLFIPHRTLHTGEGWETSAPQTVLWF